MAQPQDEIEPNLSHIHWSFPEAIAANPARSLATPDLAMDYFAYSPFWDPKSNNNVLRTQRRIEQPYYGHAEEKLELGAFKSGFEYIVAHSKPPEMFIIHKREVRPDGRRDQVSGIYWIQNDRIYPSATPYDIMVSRMKNAAHLISDTFSTLSALHPPSNPRISNVWRSLPPSDKPKPSNSSVQEASGSGSGIGVNTAAPTPSGDIQMTESQPPVPANGARNPSGSQPQESEEEGEEEEPDWNLFHALQSTRSALSDISQLSRSPIPPKNPVDELRAIESGSTVGPGSSLPPSSIGTGTPAGETPGTRVGTPGSGIMGFGLGPVGGRLRTTSHIASSPLAR